MRHPTIKRLLAALLTIGVGVAGALVLTGGPAAAVPVRDVTPWSVLLCRFSDKPVAPKPVKFFADFLTDAGKGTGGMADYLADQSGGRVTLTGSSVHGWFPMTWTQAQYQPIDRATRIQRCVDTASAAGYNVPAGDRVAVILNDTSDAGSAGGRVLLDPPAWNMRFAAHEMLHGYALGHSYSDDTSYQNADWSKPGEYDDMWDEMSAQHTYAVATPAYGASAVGLNAYHRDKLGWLPMSRVVTVGADGTGSRTITLAPLETPAAAGPLLVRIPFNPGDLYNYYTVEYRRKTGASAGIPGDTVLLHEIRNGTPYLLRSGPGGPPAQSLDANGVHLTVQEATVTVTTDVVDRCLSGWVWRAAREDDLVCVTPAARAQVVADNAAASDRWVSGAEGDHTCVTGFVWREAFTGDDTCTTPDQRALAQADNAAAAARRNPARSVFGPNKCAAGFVWRAADQTDYVCVPPATRAQAAADDEAAAGRWVKGSFGTHTCKAGFVWREAFTGDDTCVTGAQRSATASDNAAAATHLDHPAG